MPTVRIVIWNVFSFLFVGWILATGPDLFAEDLPSTASSLSPADLELCKHVINGFIAERERLISGVYRISGVISPTKTSGLAAQGPFSYFAAFDVPHDQLRFDLTRPIVLHPSVGEPGKPEASQMLQKMILANGKFTKWGNLTNQAVIRTQKPKDGKGYVDPRLLGFVMISGMHDNETSWDEYVTSISRFPFSKVETISTSVTRLTREWSQGGEGLLFRYLYDFDETKGFAPILCQFQKKSTGSPEWEAMGRMTSDWKKINDVWVPIETNYEAMYLNTPPEIWLIDWESINEPVPSSFFHIDDFHLPENMSIMDYTLGAPISTRNIAGIEAIKKKAQLNPPQPEKQSSHFFFILASNMVLAVIVLAWIWYRGHKNGRQNPLV